MLLSIKELENFAINAIDGTIGHVKDFYFDDEGWAIRYLVVDTGFWLTSRKVLISPISMRHANWLQRTIDVALTREQVKNSPNIDTEKPVSRQHEMEYLGYYGYPYYWDGWGMWGAGMYPYAMDPSYAGEFTTLAERKSQDREYVQAERLRRSKDDPHLRSSKAVMGYRIQATDGEVGHVDGLIVDQETWAVRYMVVNTSNWWTGHSVLVAPPWITRMNWLEESVIVDLSREFIKNSPPYDPSSRLSREDELAIYAHYGRVGYWANIDRDSDKDQPAL